MATFVLLLHPFDRLKNKKRFRFPTNRYLISKILEELRKRGHKVKTARLTDKIPKGDVGILHCDCSVISQNFRSVSNMFGHTVNGSVFDISKRAISQARVSRDTAWIGPVIVKSNLNYFGMPERIHNKRARKAGKVQPHHNATVFTKYEVLENIGDVAENIWDNPSLSVERFVPEIDEDGFAMRTWTFWGPHGRCRRHVSKESIVKGSTVIRSDECDVPEALKATRKRLGFDYGKFDFTIHDGQPVLFDANKTPSISTNVISAVMKDIKLMGDGFEAFLKS